VGALLEALRNKVQVHLVSFRGPGEEALVEDLGKRLAEVRTVRRRQGPARRLHHRARMLWYWAGGRPLVAAKHWSPAMARVLRQTIRERRPQAALVEFAVMAQYLPYFGDLPVILTDHESGGPIPADIGAGQWGRRREARLWRRYLHHYYPRAQVLQALTEHDALQLGQALGRPVLVRPPAVPMPEAATEPGLAPPRILFFGDYRHHPNPEAAHTLAHRVLPLVREQLPEAELWLAGPNAPTDLEELGNLPGVSVLGYVDNLTGLMAQTRLLLAPLYSGAGTRIKVLTALAHGLPVVSNALGLRGVGAPFPAVRKRERVLDLVAAALELLRSPQLAAEAGAAAHQWAEANLSAEAVGQLQLERITALTAPDSQAG
jgi:glycosyltransferase involved in cell wall biosynthesis